MTISPVTLLRHARTHVASSSRIFRPAKGQNIDSSSSKPAAEAKKQHSPATTDHHRSRHPHLSSSADKDRHNCGVVKPAVSRKRSVKEEEDRKQEFLRLNYPQDIRRNLQGLTLPPEEEGQVAEKAKGDKKKVSKGGKRTHADKI